MDFLMFLYDILLLLLYTVPLTLGTVLYIQNKRRGYLYACILFISFIVDHVLLYMTEYIPWFFDLYNRMLLSVPTVKTLLYVVTLGSFLLIFSTFIKNTRVTFFWIGLALLMLFQLYTPMLADGPVKVWIYYFPAQLFMFCLGSFGIYTAKKEPDSLTDGSDGHFYRILVFCTVMAIAITLEDTVVIFHFDNYAPLKMDILNRSYTQDFLNIVLSLYAVRFLFGQLTQAVSVETHSSAQPAEHTPEDDASAVFPGNPGLPKPRTARIPCSPSFRENTSLLPGSRKSLPCCWIIKATRRSATGLGSPWARPRHIPTISSRSWACANVGSSLNYIRISIKRNKQETNAVRKFPPNRISDKDTRGACLMGIQI